MELIFFIRKCHLIIKTDMFKGMVSILTKSSVEKCQNGLFPPSCFVAINSESSALIKFNFLWAVSACPLQRGICCKPGWQRSVQHCPFCFGMCLGLFLPAFLCRGGAPARCVGHTVILLGALCWPQDAEQHIPTSSPPPRNPSTHCSHHPCSSPLNTHGHISPIFLQMKLGAVQQQLSHHPLMYSEQGLSPKPPGHAQHQ